MTEQEKIELVFNFLYSCCNMPATGLRLNGNKIQLYVDCTFECEIEINVDSIKIFE